MCAVYHQEIRFVPVAVQVLSCGILNTLGRPNQCSSTTVILGIADPGRGKHFRLVSGAAVFLLMCLCYTRLNQLGMNASNQIGVDLLCRCIKLPMGDIVTGCPDNVPICRSVFQKDIKQFTAVLSNILLRSHPVFSSNCMIRLPLPLWQLIVGTPG